MPDELCRRCGFELKLYLKCEECRRPSQFVCINCGKKTQKQFHFNCTAKVKPITEIVLNNVSVA